MQAEHRLRNAIAIWPDAADDLTRETLDLLTDPLSESDLLTEEMGGLWECITTPRPELEPFEPCWAVRIAAWLLRKPIPATLGQP